MRRRDFLAGTGALLLSGLPNVSLAQNSDKGGLMPAQSKLNSNLIAKLQAVRGEGENIIISPASLTAILSVLALGADDKMQAALHRTLALDGSGRDVAGDFDVVRAMLRDLGMTREEQGAVFTLANLIVIDPKSRPHIPVMDKLRDHAQVMVEDLSQPATIAHINSWASEQTKGFIPQVLDGPLSQAGLAGINAMYFKGLWQTPFDANLTQTRPFQTVGGASTDVPLMTRTGSYGYRQDGRFVAVELPYRNKRFGLVMATTTDRPAPAAEFAPVTGWLSGEGFGGGRIDLSIPRFTTNVSTDLLDVLDALGLQSGRALPTAFAPLSPVQQTITKIMQQTYLQVDEKGTEAAATTSVVTTRTSSNVPPLKITVDKPFVFALRDRVSGLFLMSGYVGRIGKNSSVAVN